MTLFYFAVLIVAFVLWAYWPRLEEWRNTPPEIEEPRHEHITIHEDDPCPDCQ